MGNLLNGRRGSIKGEKRYMGERRITTFFWRGGEFYIGGHFYIGDIGGTTLISLLLSYIHSLSS